MAAIIGSPILPSGAGAGFAAVTAAAASTVTQNGLALVTLGVTAGGGDGSYSYAWTLFGPLGVDRSVLLSSYTVAAPTFTPRSCVCGAPGYGADTCMSGACGAARCDGGRGGGA